jgi:hypothetical protein
MAPKQIHSRVLQYLEMSDVSLLMMDTVEFQLAVAITLGQYSEYTLHSLEIPLRSHDKGRRFSLIVNQMIHETTRKVHLVAEFRVRHGREMWTQEVRHPFTLSNRSLYGFYFTLFHTYEVDTSVFIPRLQKFLEKRPLASEHLLQYMTLVDDNTLHIEKIIQRILNRPLTLSETMKTFLHVLQTFPLEKRTHRQKQLMYLSYWKQK